MVRYSKIFALAALLAFAAGCSSAYYAGMEKMGYHKRDIMVDRVENARDAQEDAKEQFASALDRFKSVVAFDGGDLEEKYDILNSEYERCEDKAEEVHTRIAKVEDVAEALFEEWNEELNSYSSAKLRRDSAKKLSATKRKYATLIKAMKKAESRIKPVLDAFRDQVLYLKHNLNAKAIASLEGELGSIRSDVDVLVREMEKSIAEANAFIATLDQK